MKFKIVGGRRDGSWVTVETNNGSAVSRAVQMPINRPVNISPDSKLEVESKFEYETYTVRRLYGPENWVLEFLALAGMSDVEAIEHQFSK